MWPVNQNEFDTPGLERERLRTLVPVGGAVHLSLLCGGADGRGGGEVGVPTGLVPPTPLRSYTTTQMYFGIKNSVCCVCVCVVPSESKSTFFLQFGSGAGHGRVRGAKTLGSHIYLLLSGYFASATEAAAQPPVPSNSSKPVRDTELGPAFHKFGVT